MILWLLKKKKKIQSFSCLLFSTSRPAHQWHSYSEYYSVNTETQSCNDTLLQTPSELHSTDSTDIKPSPLRN